MIDIRLLPNFTQRGKNFAKVRWQIVDRWNFLSTPKVMLIPGLCLEFPPRRLLRRERRTSLHRTCFSLNSRPIYPVRSHWYVLIVQALWSSSDIEVPVVYFALHALMNLQHVGAYSWLKGGIFVEFRSQGVLPDFWGRGNGSGRNPKCNGSGFESKFIYVLCRWCNHKETWSLTNLQLILSISRSVCPLVLYGKSYQH